MEEKEREEVLPQHIAHFALQAQWARHLSRELRGAHLRGCYRLSRAECALVFDTSQGALRYQVVLHPGLSFFYKPYHPVPIPPDAERFAVDGLGEVEGVFAPDFDRSLVVAGASGARLLVKLHGGHGNVLLFDNDQQLREAFTYKYRGDGERPLNAYAADRDQLVDCLQQRLSEGAPQTDALPSCVPGLDRWLCRRYTPPKSANAAALLQDFESWVAQKAAAPYFVLSEGRPAPNRPGVYFLLDHHPQAQRFEGLEGAAQAFAQAYFQRRAWALLHRKWSQRLKKFKSYRQKQRRSSEKSLEQLERNQNYRYMADLLMAHLQDIPKGHKEVSLPDFESGRPVRIPLKPEESPQKNAERYYRKAKKQPIEREQVENKWLQAEEKIHELEKWEQELEQAAEEGLKSLRKLDKQWSKSVEAPEAQGEAGESKPFHVFALPEAAELRVGKNARGNELLLGWAQKEDLWLHARGYAGSHGILRLSGKTPLRDEILEKAASIVAFYSKGKTAELCPVMYTRRKYVRKPKGAAPGQVRVEWESVVLAPPEIPAEVEKV